MFVLLLYKCWGHMGMCEFNIPLLFYISFSGEVHFRTLQLFLCRLFNCWLETRRYSGLKTAYELWKLNQIVWQLRRSNVDWVNNRCWETHAFKHQEWCSSQCNVSRNQWLCQRSWSIKASLWNNTWINLK